MQALKERPCTPTRVTVASHPRAVTAFTKDGDVKLSAHNDIGKHDNMDTLIRNEVESATELNVPGLAEYLLPDDAFPLPPKTIFRLMNRRKTWHKDGRWCGSAEFLQPGSEESICVFIERICNRVRQLLKTQKIPFDGEERRWSAAYRNKALPGGFVIRKPDIFSHESSEEPDWSNVRADLQHKSSPQEKDAVTAQLKDGGVNVLSSQDDRHFHIGVAVTGEDIFVLYQDRAGCLRSEPFNLHDNPVEFLRIILGLTFLPKYRLGYDRSITTTDSGHRQLTVDGEDYQILNRVGKDAGIRGMGTVYWRCLRLSDSTEVIVKSSWIDRSRKLTEDVYLDRAAECGVEGVPTKIAFEHVTTSQGDDTILVSTSTIREALFTADDLEICDFEVRDLVRLVQRECGVPLACFSTMPELLFGLSDSVEAHGQLYDEADILHTEINDQSVQLRSDGQPGARHGLLQGLHHAICAPLQTNSESDSDTATGLRSCHPTYTACEILMARQYVTRKPRQDLESFFNVLLCQCIFYAGPEQEQRTDIKDIMSSLVGRWMDPDMYQAGSNKWGVLSLKRPDADTFGNFIDDTFAPYFRPLKSCICELRNLVMDPASEPTHDVFIEILRRHADSEEVRRADEGRLTSQSESKGSDVDSNRDDSQDNSEDVDAEDDEGDNSEDQDAEDKEDDSASDKEDVEEDDSGSDQQEVEEDDAQGGEGYDRAPAIALSSGSSTPVEQPVDTPSADDATGGTLATHDTEADDSDTVQGKCWCKEVARVGAGERVITCKDPQCRRVVFHWRCVRRGKNSRTSAKKWRCKECIERSKQAPPDDRGQ
ncbi:hypothetical protein EV121DRAFT_214415 [Schizophyllum commune]